MSTSPPAGDPPFNWPPPPAELDGIDVVDVTTTSPTTESRIGWPRRRRTPARATAVHTRRRRAARRRARTHDGWLLLAAGIVIGASLPGLGQVRSGAVPRPTASMVLPIGTPASLVAETASVAPVPTVGLVPTEAAARTTGLAPRAPRPAARRATSTVPHVDDAERPVRRVLEAYERAWSRMDASATRTVWPTVDDNVLQSAFAPVSEQRLRLAACDVGVSGNRALAVCLGTRQYRPLGGTARVERGRWEIAMVRDAERWRIQDVAHP